MRAGDYFAMCLTKREKVSSLFYSTGGLLMYLAAIDEISPYVVQNVLQVWEPIVSLILQLDDKMFEEDYEIDGLPCELSAFLIQELCRDYSARDGVEVEGLDALCGRMNKINLSEKVTHIIGEIWDISCKYAWLKPWSIQVHKDHLYYLDVNEYGTLELKDKRLDEATLEDELPDETITTGVVGFSVNRNNDFIYIHYGVENQSGIYAISADDLRIVNEPFLISQDRETKLWICLKNHTIAGCQDKEYYDINEKEYQGLRTYPMKLCDLDEEGIYDITQDSKGVIKSRSVRAVRIGDMRPKLYGMASIDSVRQQDEQENFLWDYLLEQTIKNDYTDYDSEASVKERLEKCVRNCKSYFLQQTPHPLSIQNIRDRYNQMAKEEEPILYKGKCWIVSAMLKLLEDNGYGKDESVANALYTFWDCFNLSVKARPTYRFPHRVGYFLLYNAVKEYKSKESTEIKDLLENNEEAAQILMRRKIFWTDEKVLEQKQAKLKPRRAIGYFDICNKQVETQICELQEGEILHHYILPPDKNKQKAYRGMIYYDRVQDKPIIRYYTADLEFLQEVVEMFGWDEIADSDVLYELGI